MSTVLAYLTQIKLTLQQWALLSLTAVVGVLIFLLRLRGSQLHQAQVNLLKQRFQTVDSVNKEQTRAAYKRYVAEYEKYRQEKPQPQ